MKRSEQRSAPTPKSRLAADEMPLPWIDALIRKLPVPGYDAPPEQRSTIATRLGNYRLTLLGRELLQLFLPLHAWSEKWAAAA